MDREERVKQLKRHITGLWSKELNAGLLAEYLIDQEDQMSELYGLVFGAGGSRSGVLGAGPRGGSSAPRRTPTSG